MTGFDSVCEGVYEAATGTRSWTEALDVLCVFWDVEWVALSSEAELCTELTGADGYRSSRAPVGEPKAAAGRGDSIRLPRSGAALAVAHTVGALSRPILEHLDEAFHIYARAMDFRTTIAAVGGTTRRLGVAVETQAGPPSLATLGPSEARPEAVSIPLARPNQSIPLSARTLAAAAGVSPAEFEVLCGFLKGSTRKEIAAARGVSHETVKTQLNELARKLGADGTRSIARRAWRFATGPAPAGRSGEADDTDGNLSQ